MTNDWLSEIEEEIEGWSYILTGRLKMKRMARVIRELVETIYRIPMQPEMWTEVEAVLEKLELKRTQKRCP